MDNIKELYEKVSKDAGLQEKFSAIMKDAEKAGEEATREKLVAFAKEAGFDVTIEEMQAFFKDLVEKDQGELSEAELDMVAGGKMTAGGAVIAAAFSVAGLGILCAVVSIVGATIDRNCDSVANNAASAIFVQGS